MTERSTATRSPARMFISSHNCFGNVACRFDVSVICDTKER